MPTYGYECKDCGDRFEVFQKMTDEPVSACRKCGGQVRKLLFPVGIVFKGPGFHTTDYRKPEPSDGAEAKPSESKPEKAKEAGETS